MTQLIQRLAALGGMLALCDMLLDGKAQQSGVRFVGALLTAGVVLELAGGAMQLLDRL